MAGRPTKAPLVVKTRGAEWFLDDLNTRPTSYHVKRFLSRT